jgi:hypothetical protein
VFSQGGGNAVRTDVPMSELEPDSLEAADLVEHREVWDKQPAESDRAFSAFTIYRDAEKRTFKLVAEQLNCSPQNIFQWSSKFNWRLRCDAYDIDQDRHQREDMARSRVRMRERHLSVAQAMLGIVARGLREWQSRIASGAAVNLAPEQLALLTKCAVEVERSTIGVDGEHRATTINVLMGVHRYDDERVGDSGDVVKGDAEGEGEVEVEYISLKDLDRMKYERMSAEERAVLDTWKTPPTKALN